MAAHVVAGFDDGVGRQRVAFKRQGTAEDGQRQLASLKHADDAPEADATAVLEHRFGREITPSDPLTLPHGLGQPRLRVAIPIRKRWLRAFLIIEHEIQRQTCATGPLGVRGVWDHSRSYLEGRLVSSYLSLRRRDPEKDRGDH